MLRIFLFASLIFLSVSASAENYWWAIQGEPTTTRADTPLASCKIKHSQLLLTNPTYSNVNVIRLAANNYTCDIWETGKPGLRLYVWRLGDGCADPAVFDPATDSCKSPEPSKCESSIGKFVTHQHNRGTLSDRGGVLQNTLKEPPGVVCDNSCQYASTGEAPTNCYRFVGAGGDQNSAFCTYRYKGNGVECKTSDTAVSAPPTDLSPTREKKNECTNKVTDGEGRVHYSCLASDKMQEPGNMQCGEVNGEFGCIAGKPSPQKKETETKTEVTDAPASHGSSTTTTTTTTNTTNCSGVNACSTTTSVTNGTSKTNSDGTSGGESSTCTGSGCKEQTPEEKEEEEEEKPEVTGDQCSQTLACTGDVVQCAILKKNKEQLCAWDYEKSKSGIESEIAKPEYQIKESDTDVSGLFSAGLSAARWLPATCPIVPTQTLHNGISVNIGFGDVCTLANGVGFVFVGLASVFFAVYVGRAFGGS